MYANDTWDGAEMKFTLKPGFDSWAVKVAELRIAYLAAFVTFGYSYALAPGLEKVREQIRDPAVKLIETFCLNIENSQDHELLIGPSQTPIPSLVVKLPKTLVMLPNNPSDMRFYDNLRTSLKSKPECDVHLPSAKEWPKKPCYHLDLKTGISEIDSQKNNEQ